MQRGLVDHRQERRDPGQFGRHLAPERFGAVALAERAELAWVAPLLAVVDEPSLHRLQAGPFASRGEASGAAERLRTALRLVPVIVERPVAALQ